ncbi:tail fiber domain-containing protein [Tateyamaria sp.]|uniref:tail fiber domain-containing protein n=1 Tax=Tateyamaria sp. TaxID=1929288 RepID=UPI003B219060
MKIITASALCLALSAAHVSAGAVSDPVIEAPVIVEEAASSSAGILVPLLLLAVVAVAVSSGSGGTMDVSDARLKTDIVQVGTTALDLPLYQFSYIGGMQTYEGVMAQDVLQVAPEAVVPFGYGYMAVDYGALGIEMRTID